MDVMVSNCNELERPTAPGVSPQRPALLFILLKLRLSDALPLGAIPAMMNTLFNGESNDILH